MRRPRSSLPAIVVSEHPAGGRIVYAAADIDRCFGRDNLPDHAGLLQNLIRWAAGDTLPLRVSGPGFLDCRLYRQDERMILHVVNLTATGIKPITEHIPVGPIEIAVRSSAGDPQISLRVSGGTTDGALSDGWVSFTLPTVVDHELVVIE